MSHVIDRATEGLFVRPVVVYSRNSNTMKCCYNEGCTDSSHLLEKRKISGWTVTVAGVHRCFVADDDDRTSSFLYKKSHKSIVGDHSLLLRVQPRNRVDFVFGLPSSTMMNIPLLACLVYSLMTLRHGQGGSSGRTRLWEPTSFARPPSDYHQVKHVPPQ